MDNADDRQKIIESLKLLGLTKYEGEVYIALLSLDGATATEIHEISGVPRASVYPVLTKLEEKNLVFTSHSTPKRFKTVHPDEAIASLLQEINNGAEYAKKALSTIYARRSEILGEKQGCIWHLNNAEQVRTHLEAMFRKASISVSILSKESFLTRFVFELLPVIDPLVMVEIITPVIPEGLNFPASVRLMTLPIWSGIPSHGPEGGALILVDSHKVLMVMEDGDHNLSALYSCSTGLVSFFLIHLDYIQNVLKTKTGC